MACNGDCVTFEVRDVRTQIPLNVTVDYSLLSDTSGKFACQAAGDTIQLAHGKTPGADSAKDGLSTPDFQTYTCTDDWVIDATKLEQIKAIVSDAIKRLRTTVMAVYQTEQEGTIQLQGDVANCNAKDGLTTVFSDLPLQPTVSDFYLYVTANPVLIYNGQGQRIQSNAAAWPCHYAKRSMRPIVGLLTIMPDQIFADTEYMASVALHELVQALGWVPELAKNGFYSEWNENYGVEPLPYPVENFALRADRSTKRNYQQVERFLIRPSALPNAADWNSPAYSSWQSSRPIGTPPKITGINTRNVLEQARIHFMCPQLTAVEVEDYTHDAMGFGTAYTDFPDYFTVLWERRIAKGEVMNMRVDVGAALSSLTLAVLHDSGFYKADYTAAEYLQWGEGAGCAIPLLNCYYWAYDNFPDAHPYTCVSMAGPMFNPNGQYSAHQCMPKGLQKGSCNSRTYASADYNAAPKTPREYMTTDSWFRSTSYYAVPGAGPVNRETIARQSGGCDAMMDYCPVFEAVGPLSSCLDPALLNGVNPPAKADCRTTPCKPYSIAGSTSACFTSNIKFSAFSYTAQFSGTCLPYTCEPQGDTYNLILTVGNTTATCTDARETEALVFAGSMSGADPLSGQIKCPHATTFCNARQELSKVDMYFKDEITEATVAGTRRMFTIQGRTRTASGREVIAKTATNEIIMCLISGKIDSSATARLTRGGTCRHIPGLDLTHKICNGLSIKNGPRSSVECYESCCSDDGCTKWQYLRNGVCKTGSGICSSSDGQQAVAGSTINRGVDTSPPTGALQPGESCVQQFSSRLGFEGTPGEANFGTIFRSLSAEVLFYGIGSNFDISYLRRTVMLKPGPPDKLTITKPANFTEIQSDWPFNVEVDVTDSLGNPAAGAAAGSECPWGAETGTDDLDFGDGTLVVDGKCYQYFSQPLTKVAAREVCTNSYGGGLGKLASIQNAEIETLFRTAAGTSYWTGLEARSRSTPLNVLWDSGASTAWWKGVYGNPSNIDYNWAFPKGCCVGLWESSQPGYAKTLQYQLNPSIDQCIIYNPAARNFYPYEAVACEGAYPFFCEFRPTLDIILDLVNVDGLVTAPIGVYSGNGKVQFEVRIKRETIGGMDPAPTALLQATSPSDRLISAGAVMLKWKPSPSPSYIRAYFTEQSGAKYNYLETAAGMPFTVFADATDSDDLFVSWSESITIQIWDPSDEDTGLLASTSCFATSSGGCFLALNEIDHPFIKKARTLEARAQSGNLIRKPLSVMIKIVPGAPCKLVSKQCPVDAMFSVQIGVIKFVVTDCYDNEVCEESERDVFITGNSQNKLESTITGLCQSNPTPTACCSSQTTTQTCNQAGCLWGKSGQDPSLCPEGKCCWSRNGGQLTPLIGGSNYRLAPQMCFPNGNAVLYTAGTRSFVRNGNCEYDLSDYSNIEDIFYIKPLRTGKLSLKVSGLVKTLIDNTKFTEIGSVCRPEEESTGAFEHHDSYLFDNDWYCDRSSRTFDIAKCNIMTEQTCKSLCTNSPSTSCLGVQYTAIAPTDKSWKSTGGIQVPRAYGRAEILGAASDATGCPAGNIPWQSSWLAASEDQILTDLLNACNLAMSGEASSLCCGTANGGKCNPTTCVKVPRLVTDDCPISRPFPYTIAGNPQPYRCCSHEVTDGTCTNSVLCSSEPLSKMHGSWKVSIQISSSSGVVTRTYTFWGAPDDRTLTVVDVADATCSSGRATVINSLRNSNQVTIANVGCKNAAIDPLPTISGRSFKRPDLIGRTFIGCYNTRTVSRTKEMSDPLQCQAFCGGDFWTMSCPQTDGSFTCKCVDQATFTGLVKKADYECFNQRTETCPGGVITSDAHYGTGGENVMALYGGNSNNRGLAPCAPYHSYPTTRCELIMQGRDQTDAIIDATGYNDFRRASYFNSKSFVIALKTAGTLTDSKQTCYRKGFKYQAPLPRMSIQIFGPGTSLQDIDDKRDASSLWNCFPEMPVSGSVMATRDRVDQGKYYAVKITTLEKSENFPVGVRYTVQQKYSGGGVLPDPSDALLGCSGYGDVDPFPQCTPGFACPTKCGDITFNGAMLRGPDPCSASTLEVVATSEGLATGTCQVNMGCGFFQFDTFPESIISGEALQSGLITFSVNTDAGIPNFVPENIGWELTIEDCHDNVIRTWTSTSTTLLTKGVPVYSSTGLSSQPGSWFPDGYLGYCEELTLIIGSTTHSIQKAYQTIVVLPGLPWEVHIKEDIPTCSEACDPDIVSGCEPLRFSAVLKTKNGMVSQTDGVFCFAEAGHFDESLNDYVAHPFSAISVLGGTTNSQGEVSFTSGYTTAGNVKVIVTCACSTCRPDAQKVRFQRAQGFITIYPAAPAAIQCVKSPVKALAMDRIDLMARLQDTYGNGVTERVHGMSLTVNENGPGEIIGQKTSIIVGGVASWSIKTDKIATNMQFSMAVSPAGLSTPKSSYSFAGCLNDYTSSSILDTNLCTRTYRSFMMTPSMCAKKCAIFPTFIITSEDEKKSQLCICSREVNIVPAYGAASRDICNAPGCSGDSSGLHNMACGSSSTTTDHRYLAVYRRETAYPQQLISVQCPSTTIYPNRAYRLELADQPCAPNDVGVLTGDYNQRCLQESNSFDCPQAAVGQSLSYIVHVRDAGGNLADVKGDYADCAHPSTPRDCADEVQLTATPEGGEISAQGVCTAGYPDNMISLAISGFIDTKGRVTASVSQSTRVSGRILVFTITSTAAQCVIATAESDSGLQPSQTSRKICFHAGPISNIVIVNPPESQAALGPFPLMTANVFDRYENLVKWSSAKLGIFPWDDGAPPLSLDRCRYNGVARKLNSLVRIGARFADGTGEAEPFKPTAQLRDGVTSFGGFAYSAVERGLDTACFKLRLELKRSETPSILGCPAGGVSDDLIQDLNLRSDEYATIEGMSGYIPIMGPKLVIVQPTVSHIIVIAGEIFNVAVSIELADGTQCWVETNCQIEQFSVSMEYVSGPSAVCPKCGRDVLEDGRIVKFNNLFRYNAGTYIYNFWGNAGNAKSAIGAPAPFKVTILPGAPEKLRFKNCNPAHKAIAGELFNHVIEVLDGYNNPTTSWEMDITLSAAVEVTSFFGVSSRGALYSTWNSFPPASNLQGSDEAMFSGLLITKASKWFLIASSPGLRDADCRIEITPAQPDNCRAFTTDFSFEVPHPFWKAGDDFKVRVQFFDAFANPITEQLKGGFQAKINLVDAQGELGGETSKEIMGQSVVFTTRYLRAPETITISAEVPGSNVLPCQAPELPIVAADPCCLAFTEIKERVNGDPTKLPLEPIMGKASGNSILSPLRAGEEFCATVVIQDTYGNIVDETDAAVRALYKTVNEFQEPSILVEDVGCDSDPIEDEFDFPDFGGGGLFGGLSGFSLFGEAPSITLNDLDTGSCTPIVEDPIFGEDPTLDGTGFDIGILDPISNLGIETSPAELPATYPNRRVSLSRKRCAATCIGDDELGGITTLDSVNGVFQICGITYNRAECIFLEATSQDLVSAVSPKICISHAPWAKLSCVTDTRLVAQGQPFRGFTGLLTDTYGNSARTCTRDGGSCAVTIRELPETDDNGYVCCGRVTDSELTPGELTGDGLTVSGSTGIATYTDDFFYSRARPAASDPLRLELTNDDGSIRAQCGAMTVLGIRIVCDDSPAMVLAGDEFSIRGSVIKRVNGQFTPIECPANTNCDTMSYARVMTGGWVLENSRFAKRPAAAGLLPTTCDGLDTAACEALAADCAFGQSPVMFPFDMPTTRCNLLAERRVQNGIAAVNGVMTFDRLTYYRSAVIKLEITPRSNRYVMYS